MNQEELLTENIKLASMGAKELTEEVGQDVKNVLDLYHIAYRIQTINATFNGPKILDEALVMFQIDALNVAKIALRCLNIPSAAKVILEVFVTSKMQDAIQ